MTKIFSCLASLSLVAATASAAILYEPTPIGSSVRISEFASTDQTGFRAFDNFTLGGDSVIQRVTWRGIWLDFNNPVPAAAPSPNVLSWEFSFYADNAGIPGSQLSVETVAAANVTSTFQGTGVFNAGSQYNVSFYEYAFDLTLPFAATGGTQYWFSVLANSANYNPAFALRGATGGDDSSYQQQLGAGQSVLNSTEVARDRAIRLEGVPEPSTVALSAIGLLLLPVVRRLRRR